jgi:hypothetical protein
MVKIVEQATEGFASTPEPNVFMVVNFPFCEPVFLLASPGKLTVISEARASSPGGGFKKIGEMF